ncbi:hypothetical protein HY492_00835 [Candidatus Woesearchaeota archaeon]|nr:hypothetical protein [Candidatus Woesearchaeota archaeon]
MKESMHWLVIGIPVIGVSIAGLLLLGPWLNAVINGILFGVGITLLIRGIALAKHARKSVRLPFAAIVYLLILPVVQMIWLHMIYQIIIQLIAIIAIFVLAFHVWRQLSAGAERRDDDVKRNGFEVWK